ncbi:MAG TPA: Gfo/Idh/MocA family oxidoreductase [Mycobacteriales bacterium]|jgi:predicted dehydrogenase|nr:Gfo/Idh/MocA family oxidoreductase [Mycobacteriales bacterium]
MSMVTVVADLEHPGAAEAFAGYARRCGCTVEERASADGLAGSALLDVVVVLSDRPPSVETERALAAYADRGGVLVLAGPTAAAWRESTGLLERAGLVPLGPTVPHELRVRPGRDAGDVAARLDGDLLTHGPLLLLEKVLDDVEVLLTANWQLVDHPVATVRRAAGTVAAFTLGAAPEAWDGVALPRLLHRVVRHALRIADGPEVRVGLLGYGAIGAEHATAVALTEGLSLAAVCDRNAGRVAAALSLAPGARAVADADALLADDGVDLVIVSTPPDTHAAWALRALTAGKHVVVEKPFCLTTAEADDMVALARERDRVLAVYQNRRWDADFLALRRVVRSGAIGEVFHLESFVGGYGHPCNYWHSDEEVSGGAIYDWGSHHLDWTLDLMPQPVEWVSAVAHKRVWHDVTNADHSRVTVHFADGAEAEFVHSDLAATPKPKWYVIGTRGAVRGDWRYERVVARDAVGNLAEDRLTAAESPALLTVCTPDGYGGVHEQRLSVPPPPARPFHRELADRLLSGEPMSVTPEGSRRNIAVMEAATASARDGGRPVAPREVVG